MKKLALIAVICLIIIACIFGIYIYSHSNPASNNSEQDLALQEKILNNSTWIPLEKDDFYGYLNGTYTPSVQTIIESLEESVPVIFQTSNDKFGTFENYTFIVASAFNAENQIYTYYYSSEANTYTKILASLENLLENSHAVYIYKETEEL